MATFTGTVLREQITPAAVSATVIRNPPGAFPSLRADTLSGGGGRDTLDGGGGLDVVTGGDGDDRITVRALGRFDGGWNDDLLVVATAGPGTTIEGGSGTDTLDPAGSLDISGAALSGIEVLALDANPLTLTAAQLGGVPDIAAAGGAINGAVVLSAGGLADVGVAGLATLAVTGSGEADQLIFSTAGVDPTDLLLDAGLGEDTIVAAGGEDSLEGGGENDTLLGGLGDDTLKGGVGDDRLFGEEGEDRLTGGGGLDRFVFEGPSQGQGRITDFTAGEDRIEVAAASFGGGLVAGVPLTADQLVVHASRLATAPAATGQFVFDTTQSLLLWDADGSGGLAEVELARLPGVASLAVTDFEVSPIP